MSIDRGCRVLSAVIILSFCLLASVWFNWSVSRDFNSVVKSFDDVDECCRGLIDQRDRAMKMVNEMMPHVGPKNWCDHCMCDSCCDAQAAAETEKVNAE